MDEITPLCDVDFFQFKEKWDSLYNDRSVRLSSFANDHGLSLDADHQAALDDIVRRGRAVEQANANRESLEALVASMQFQKEDDGYGFYTYSVVAENTTGIDWADVSLLLALYDSEGVKAGEVYANTSSWAQGEKVRFEAFSDVDAIEIKVSLEYFDVAAGA